jgi:VanZ family protein
MRRSWGDTVRRWGPVAAWLLVISALSSGWFSGVQTGYFLIPVIRWLFPSATWADLLAAHRLVRKLAHFAEFLVLGVLLYRALDGAGGFRPRIALQALALAALCAVADELHQWFVTGRTASAWDSLIDTSGAAAGLALLAARARVFMARVPARP